MSDMILFAAAAVVGASVGFGGGYAIGARIRARSSWVYWLANVVALLMGVGIGFLGLWSRQMWLFIAAVALMGGVFSGIKYGYARVVAPWDMPKVAEEPDD
ncbi:MAG: hypothetical protein OEV43_07625 [Coriobacteriia bacterium]|nr:hypothetical protein [Coriobacteriia bacterium]